MKLVPSSSSKIPTQRSAYHVTMEPESASVHNEETRDLAKSVTGEPVDTIHGPPNHIIPPSDAPNSSFNSKVPSLTKPKEVGLDQITEDDKVIAYVD